VAVVLAAAAFAAYIPSLSNAFLNWDDNVYVADNPHVATGLSWDTFRWAFTSFHASNWHPLTWLSHAADVEIHGRDDPGGHHLTNVLLHAANTVLLLVVLRRLTGRLWPSAVVAALFALHPLHVESVAWVAERKDLLCALFMFLAILAYASYASEPSRRRYLLVVAAFAAALMSKPMAVTLPAVLLVLDWWPLRRLNRSAVLEKVPLAAMSAASAIVTFVAQHAGGAVRELRTLGIGARVANALYACVMYLVKAVWPRPGALVPFYPLADRGGPAVSAWMAAGAALLLAALTVLAVRQRRRRPYLLAGWLIYLVTLVPVIGLVQIGKQVMADRYTYVPLTGVFLAVTFLVADAVSRRARLRKAVAAAALLGLVALGGLTWHQQRVWADSKTFWLYVSDAFPRDSVSLKSLGDLHAGGDRTARALAFGFYRRAASVQPDDFLACANLGNALRDAGRLDEAEANYRHALQVKPDFPPAHNGLGVVLLDRGRHDEAANCFSRALELAPGLTAARVNLGNALAGAGHHDAAIEAYRAAIEEYRSKPKLRPNMVLTIENLGLALMARGDTGGAIREFRDVLREMPLRPEAHENLAAALIKAGRPDEARRHVLIARELRRGQGPPGR